MTHHKAVKDPVLSRFILLSGLLSYLFTYLFILTSDYPYCLKQSFEQTASTKFIAT